MREIKFRGMDINGDWHYGLLAYTKDKRICPELGWYISNSSGASWAYRVRPETIGQYTGRKDKNGKEIYKGDIVKLNQGHTCRHCNKAHDSILTFVDWQGDGFRLYELNCDDYYYELSNSDMEIIGNIYENPELLEKHNRRK